MTQSLSYQWWWLSFADAARPKGTQSLGVAIVGPVVGGMKEAVGLAHALGCNPGGEVLGWVMDAIDDVPPWARNRLLTRAECEQFGELIRV